MNIQPLALDDVLPTFHPDNIHPQPSTSIVITLFSHAASNGSAADPVDINELDADLTQYEDTLDEIAALGWIYRENGTISLLPLGISIAGPRYYDVAEHLN